MDQRNETITEDHRKFVFSFIRMLQRVKTDDVERCKAIVQMLGEEFKVDPAGLGGLHDTGVDALEVFKKATGKHKARDAIEQDEKFKSFISLLASKNYFKEHKPGTPEYEQLFEKACEKFIERNNPYDGLTAEQIKNKGNELMGQAKYKEAIACYTKAIEMEPKNAVFFANRAAAHTHLKDYSSAIIDCEQAIVINPNYSKSFSRLGTALFYQENYARAADAFGKACELDPGNATYKADLKRAQEKAAPPAAAGPWGGGGLPGMGGMPDLSQFASLMNNPQFMETAQNMMQNPEFSNLVLNMASRFGQGGFDPAEIQRLGAESALGMREVDEEGNAITPFGKVSQSALAKLQEEARENPKFASIMADVQANGPAAFQKYMGDPDTMNLMLKFHNLALSGKSNEN